MSDTCKRARVRILGKAAEVITEDGSKALIPVHKLCETAKRLGLCFENYQC